MSGDLAKIIKALHQVLATVEKAEKAIGKADDLLDDTVRFFREPLAGAEVEAEVFGLIEQGQMGLRQALPLCSRADEAVGRILATASPGAASAPATTTPRPDPPSRSVPHPSTLPKPLMDRALDPAWAREQQAKLADRTSDTATTGLLTVPGGDDLYITSGFPRPQQGQPLTEVDRAELDRLHRVELTLRTSGFAATLPDRGQLAVTGHVEVKAASIMRELGLTFGKMAINHTAVCRGPYGCVEAVPMLLPQGSMLVVWERGATEPIVLKGKATP
ncbi:hypothetical protein M8C13_07035 [Crossiella sp. SN42]|uniref:DddA-like double-stranded DNA deaminase toxin n=1 Tax=Crossiella sp. SN42 TaxID=2944808 RepID=UPI00207CFA57|nr:DddA-like double-stranded DNA deaminase toxin [Crossiella sp. SN42]MCO1575511.1 hypothetical protein [Crossiella sp. SN42]